MARLILKSPYIKGGAKAGSYAKYIATRERVELIPDGRPATKKQEQLIADLVKDFPDAKKLPEYSDYRDAPNKVNASAFIAQALEDNWDALSRAMSMQSTSPPDHEWSGWAATVCSVMRTMWI